jgi:hypothetical protein
MNSLVAVQDLEDSVITNAKPVAGSRTPEFFASGREGGYRRGADFSHDPAKLDVLDATNMLPD